MAEESWQELMGKDIQLKKIVPGIGEPASMGTIVDCTLTGYLRESDNVNDKSFESIRIKIQVGEGDVVPGLELPLRHSKSGDTLRVRCTSKFAYGMVGRKPNPKDNVAEIPPNSDLEYLIEVHGHYENAAAAAGLVSTEIVDQAKWSHDLAAHDITLRKECGNRWFSYGDYPKATKAYAKGVQLAEGYLNSAGDGGGNDDELVTNLFIMCLNNLAACHVLKGENVKAKELCIRVLEIDPDNTKALLRAGRVSSSLDDFESAEACLQRLLTIEPNNEAATKEMTKLKRARANYKAKQKEMSKSMARHLFKDKGNDNSNSSNEVKTADGSLTNTMQTDESSNENDSYAIEPQTTVVKPTPQSEESKSEDPHRGSRPNDAIETDPTKSSSKGPAASSSGDGGTTSTTSDNNGASAAATVEANAKKVGNNTTFLMLAANVIVLLLSLGVALWLQHRFSQSQSKG